MCKGAANVQAFMPGDRVEYRSKSMGGKWLPGVVQSFNDQTNTYFLYLISGQQVPEATPQKLRKVAFQPGDKVKSWSESMGEKWLSATEQSFNPREGDGKVVQGTVVGVPSNWGVMCKGAANVQAFMPGDRVEYRSKSMGGKWLPGVVQSFNDQTNTYFLNLISGAQVPEATPQKLRKVAFQPGDKVESWSKSMGEKWLSATEQSFNPREAMARWCKVRWWEFQVSGESCVRVQQMCRLSCQAIESNIAANLWGASGSQELCRASTIR